MSEDCVCTAHMLNRYVRDLRLEADQSEPTSARVRILRESIGVIEEAIARMKEKAGSVSPDEELEEST